MRKGTYTHIIIAAIAVAIVGVVFIFINTISAYHLGIMPKNEASSTISPNITISTITSSATTIV